MRRNSGEKSRRGFIKEAGALAVLAGFGLAGEKSADAQPRCDAHPRCEVREQNFVRLQESNEKVNPGDIKLIIDAVYSHSADGTENGNQHESVNFLRKKVEGYEKNEVWMDPNVEKKLMLAEQ